MTASLLDRVVCTRKSQILQRQTTKNVNSQLLRRTPLQITLLLSQYGIQADRRLVQDHQLRLVHQRTGERHAALLAAAQVDNVALLRRQFQQVLQHLEALTDAIVVHAVDAAKVENRFLDGQFVDQRNVLQFQKQIVNTYILCEIIEHLPAA